ncbi:hypothetical protein [Streptomyces sp. NRRL WC-3618]|uniref:hypothetical protein n=1 Tax=Streptomyces sp. NRRL WC-3618 TaxID=1519490 RepID=UPI000A654426|nr:hypothetical protein [Streptomyces sp. NRRL WC-3618]
MPVLRSWTVDDLRWALRQDSAVFFALTNTRSLSPEDAAGRNREVVRARPLPLPDRRGRPHHDPAPRPADGPGRSSADRGRARKASGARPGR